MQARLKQRSDDTREKILSRLTAYHANTEPILEFYKELLVPIKV
jgi:adenylate kinase family enzyme